MCLLISSFDKTTGFTLLWFSKIPFHYHNFVLKTFGRSVELIFNFFSDIYQAFLAYAQCPTFRVKQPFYDGSPCGLIHLQSVLP